MEDKIKQHILDGNFLKASEALRGVDIENLLEMLIEVGYEEESICSYTFVNFLLIENETSNYHCLISDVLVSAFYRFEGAIQTALHHTKRALELSPNNVYLMERLLFFNMIPEKLLTDKEAEAIARLINERLPGNDFVFGEDVKIKRDLSPRQVRIKSKIIRNESAEVMYINLPSGKTKIINAWVK